MSLTFLRLAIERIGPFAGWTIATMWQGADHVHLPTRDQDADLRPLPSACWQEDGIDLDEFEPAYSDAAWSVFPSEELSAIPI